MDCNETLESTNRVLHDLERKLLIGLTASLAQSATSHGSVVRNPANTGLARRSIQLSVLRYLHSSDFDPKSVYADRQSKFSTAFGREYLPVSAHATELPEYDLDEYTYDSDGSKNGGAVSASDGASATEISAAELSASNPSTSSPQIATSIPSPSPTRSPKSSTITNNTVTPISTHPDDALSPSESLSPSADSSLDYDYYTDGDWDDEWDDMLLPPSPPRLPPRDLDPAKLYGLYDFSGPDPLHCTLARDEPVELVNDDDSYWWLVRKMTRAERAALALRRGTEVLLDGEDGKVGFVPAECLETHVERLARLNCYRNEDLERAPEWAGAPEWRAPEWGAVPEVSAPEVSARAKKGRKVTFEGVADLNWDDDDDDDFVAVVAPYYRVGEVPVALPLPEVLSDVFSDVPLVVTKRGDSDKTVRGESARIESAVQSAPAETAPSRASLPLDASPDLAPRRRRPKRAAALRLPVLGKLDELTEKLAELENFL